jgi:hypothetical protein
MEARGDGCMAKKLKWGTIDYLQALVDEYFKETPYPNIAGLCLKLGIHRDTWHYYTADQWKTHRKSEEEIEAMELDKLKQEEAENGAFEELMEISERTVIYSEDDIENDALKARVSDVLKKAQLRFEDFNNRQIYSAKNPAGPIFIAKACFGMRETAPEEANQAQIPPKITINILPPQQAPQQIIQGAKATYSVVAEIDGVGKKADR